MVVGALDHIHRLFPNHPTTGVSPSHSGCKRPRLLETRTSHSTCTESSSVYVAYPKIAQSAVNDSTLDITEMILSNPTPESFHLEQRQVLGSKSSYHPQIYAFDSEVSLAGEAPFAHVTVPAVKSKDGAVIHFEQNVALTNATAFADYTTAVMLNEEVSLNIYGRPGLKQGGLPKTTVTYNKTVVMKGMFLFLVS